MSKTIDLQVEKSRSLIGGYRAHIDELRDKGVNTQQRDKMEADLGRLIAAGEQCDQMRAQLSEQVRQMNEILQTVKDDFLEQKKIVKSAYEQPQWQRYGVLDKR